MFEDNRNRPRRQRGQGTFELVIQLPLLLLLLFGCVQLARVFYLYHMLQNAVRGGAALLSRSVNVNYCDPQDATIVAARNVVVYGNMQGDGTPLIQGMVPEMIEVFPERVAAGTTAVGGCPCSGDADGCDVPSGGRAPDFVVVNLGSGYPLPVPFPFINLGTINLKVSVRMPVTGG